MKMGELCNRSVVIADPQESARGAAQRMREHHVGCLIVVDRAGGLVKPVAVVTDRDLVVSALADESADPAQLQLSQVMSSELVSAREDEDIYDVIQRMRARGVRRVPVTDSDGRLLGIFTFDDVLEWLTEQLEGLSGVVHREQHRERETRP